MVYFTHHRVHPEPDPPIWQEYVTMRREKYAAFLALNPDLASCVAFFAPKPKGSRSFTDVDNVRLSDWIDDSLRLIAVRPFSERTLELASNDRVEREEFQDQNTCVVWFHLEGSDQPHEVPCARFLLLDDSEAPNISCVRQAIPYLVNWYADLDSEDELVIDAVVYHHKWQDMEDANLWSESIQVTRVPRNFLIYDANEKTQD